MAASEAVPGSFRPPRSFTGGSSGTPADVGYDIRIGSSEISKPKNKSTHRWLRVVLISDTHNKQDGIGNVPEGDVLLHCGDATMSGKASKVKSFGKWMAALPHRYKLFVPGNHDYTLDPEYYGERGLWSRLHSSPRFSSLAEADACLAGTVILRDCSVSLHGLNFHGFPHIPEPHGRKMAFCHDLIAEGKPTPTMDAPLSKIPHDTDVLAVHGPAYKFLDQIAYGKRSVGSASLREWVLQHRPAVVACGHIHEARGVLRDAASSVTFVNAACLTHQYRRIENAATVMDIGIPVSEGAHGHALREGPSSSEGGVPKCACEAQGEVPPDALPEPRSTAMHASNPQERIDITDPQYVPLLHRDGAA